MATATANAYGHHENGRAQRCRQADVRTPAIGALLLVLAGARPYATCHKYLSDQRAVS